MIKSSIEKLSEEIGFDIANSDDVVQSKFLNGFCEGLKCSMQPHALETQLCYISKKLTSKSDEIILALAEFVKLKNQ